VELHEKKKGPPANIVAPAAPHEHVQSPDAARYIAVLPFASTMMRGCCFPARLLEKIPHMRKIRENARARAHPPRWRRIASRNIAEHVNRARSLFAEYK
jgi:hypothetical protein